MSDSPLTVRTAVLIALLDGQAYLAELRERLGDETSRGALLPALKKLVEGGFLERQEGPAGEARGRPKTYYRLTGAGFNEAHAQWDRLKELCAKAPTRQAARRSSGARRGRAG